MEGIDWYWLMLMRCSKILGLVVEGPVVVLIDFGLISRPLRLLGHGKGTIIRVRGLFVLL